MSQQLGGQPIIIMREGSTTTRGQDAQNSNFTAARAGLRQRVSSQPLAPGAWTRCSSMVFGDITITNDGVTILKEMDIDHPAAKMMVEIAKTQDAEVGDGRQLPSSIAGRTLKER